MLGEVKLTLLKMQEMRLGAIIVKYSSQEEMFDKISNMEQYIKPIIQK